MDRFFVTFRKKSCKKANYILSKKSANVCDSALEEQHPNLRYQMNTAFVSIAMWMY